jgi:endogenous inhibitor of DNA gyrase (YacG/DUF329 family)
LTSEPRQRPCPTCGRLLAWDPRNPYRPFCSERCRLIDLGEWFGEERRIPLTEEAAEPFPPDRTS